MCGLAGLVRWDGRPDGEDVAAVLAMLDAQAQRGPDDWGLLLPRSLTRIGALPARAGARDHVRTYDDTAMGPAVMLGVRRLSILDRSPRGGMPMGDERGRLWVTHNGEIYNHRELRHELASAEAPFRSGADTEAILRGYARWGCDVVSRLRGMFAFVLFETGPPPRVMLARDRLGIKPLYYHRDADRLIWASDVRALLRSGLVRDEANPEAVVRFLQLGSVPAPQTTIRGVMALEAGQRLTMEGGRTDVRRYWSAGGFAPESSDRRTAPDRGDAAVRTRELLDELMGLHLQADVPLGVFLSGGIDSSALVALAASRRDRPLATLTLAFDEPAYSEAGYARLVARRFATDHREVRLGAGQFWDAVPGFFRAMDEPTVDGINTYLVAAAARREGLTVMLSGTGGDEVFWGYRHLRRGAWLESTNRLMAALPGPARGGLVRAARYGVRAMAPGGLARLDYLDRPSASGMYLLVRGLFGAGQVRELLGLGAAELDAYGPPLPGEGDGGPPVASGGHALGLSEIHHYLQNQLLKDTDVMSMAHSVEVRLPFLDHRLVEFVVGLPARIKRAGPRPKPLLLAALGDVLPAAAWRRPKMGFTLPFTPWLRGRAGELRARHARRGARLGRLRGGPRALVAGLGPARARPPRRRARRGGRVSSAGPGHAEGERDPAAPWMVIDAARPRRAIDVAECWRYRDLLYFLTRRDVAVRYKQTVLGFLWAIIQPLTSMVVFAVFLGALAGMPSDGIPYPVFSYLGLLPWMYFAGAVTRSGSSLVSNAHVLTRVYFPRVLVPLAATLAALVDTAIATVVLVGLMAWYGLIPGASMLLVIPLMLVTACLAAGVGMGLGALNAQYRDVQHAVPFLMQLWMFATPVVYPASIVPERWRPLLALNPLAGLVEGFRAAALGRPLDWPGLGISIASAAVLSLLGVWQFRRIERDVADTV